MKPRFNTGMINRVRKTFKKMTFGSDTAPKRETLVTINLAPLMARRDAAYERALELISDDLFSHSDEKRSEIYQSIASLLEIAIEASKITSKPTRHSENPEERAILQYLLLLNDTVQAAARLAKHEVILYEDENALSDFIGEEITSQFRSADEVFSDSEMNVFHCIQDLIEIANISVKRNREYGKKNFSKPEQARYDKAYMEFEDLYSKTGPEREPEATPESGPDSE